MDKYLAIITTTLVITQIIRLTQNTISLSNQKESIKKLVEKEDVLKRILGKIAVTNSTLDSIYFKLAEDDEVEK